MYYQQPLARLIGLEWPELNGFERFKVRWTPDGDWNRKKIRNNKILIFLPHEGIIGILFLDPSLDAKDSGAIFVIDVFWVILCKY